MIKAESAYKSDGDLLLWDYWEKHKGTIARLRKWGQKVRLDESDTTSTMMKYQGMLKHLIENNEVLQNKSINQLCYRDLDLAVKGMKDKGKKVDTYSDATLDLMVTILNDIYQYAEDRWDAENIILQHLPKRRTIDRNNKNKVVIGHGDAAFIRKEYDKLKRLPRSLSEKESQKLYQCIDENIISDGRYCILALSLYLGLRPAESRALLWSDLREVKDPNGNWWYAKIVKTLDEKTTVKKRTKTWNGFRNIPVHRELLDFLKKRREFLQENGLFSEEYPIGCLENQSDRYCSGTETRIFAKSVLSTILHKELLYRSAIDLAYENLTGEGREISDSSDQSFVLYVLRRNFWTWLQNRTPLDVNEKRYVMGHEMKLGKKNIRPEYNDLVHLRRIHTAMSHYYIDRANYIRDTEIYLG